MGELTDLEVERVDGVDRPATRRRFLITKAEGDPAGDPVAEAKRLIAAAVKTLGTVRKDATGIDALSEDTLTALNELREALGEEGGEAIAKSAAPVPPVEPEVPAVPAVVPPTAGEAFSDAVIAKLATAITKSLKDAVEADSSNDDDDEADAPPPKSAQPNAPVAIAKRGARREFGKGMFSDVFGV